MQPSLGSPCHMQQPMRLLCKSAQMCATCQQHPSIHTAQHTCGPLHPGRVRELQLCGMSPSPPQQASPCRVLHQTSLPPAHLYTSPTTTTTHDGPGQWLDPSAVLLDHVFTRPPAVSCATYCPEHSTQNCTTAAEWECSSTCPPQLQCKNTPSSLDLPHDVFFVLQQAV
jgi:hypothetical protein